MKQTLRVSLLGHVTLSYEGQSTSAFSTSKVRDLLAFLVLRKGAKCGRIEIISKLWQESSLSSDRNRLSVTAYLLRKMIADCGADGTMVEGDRNNLWINSDHLEVDVWEIEAYISQSAAADTETKRNIHNKVLDLYLGPLNPNCTDHWIVPWRREVESLFSTSVDWLSRDAANSNDRVELHRILQTAIQADSDSVLVWEALAKFYDEEGDPERTMDAVNRIVAHFRSLSISPSERLQGEIERLQTKYRTQLVTDSRLAPTLVACIVDELGREFLLSACVKFGLEAGHSGDYVLAPNVIVAQQLAEELVEHHPDSKVVLHTVIQYPSDPIPRTYRSWPKSSEPGLVVATPGTYALLDDVRTDFVRERPSFRQVYGTKV